MYLILDDNPPRALQSIAYLKKQGVEASIPDDARDRWQAVEIVLVLSELPPAEITAWKERTGALAVYCTRNYTQESIRAAMTNSIHNGQVGYNGVIPFPPEVSDLKTWVTEKQEVATKPISTYTESVSQRSFKSELPNPRARIWTVVGTKGGVGKSTVSTLLANALVKAGHDPVVVVELDNNAALCKMHQVSPLVKIDAFERLPDYLPSERIEQNMVWLPNLHWWLIPSDEGPEVSNDAFQRLLNTVGNYAGELVFDCPINPFSRTRAFALAVADQSLIVAEPSNANLANVRELLTMTKGHTVILNRVLDYQMRRAKSIVKQIQTTDTVTVELIVQDRILDERVNNGLTIFASRDTEAAIRRIAGLESTKKKGWFKK